MPKLDNTHAIANYSESGFLWDAIYCFLRTLLLKRKKVVCYYNVSADEIFHEKEQSGQEMAFPSHGYRRQQDKNHVHQLNRIERLKGTRQLFATGT